MASRVHFVGDDFAFLDVANVAGEALLSTSDRIPKVNHPVLLLFFCR